MSDNPEDGVSLQLSIFVVDLFLTTEDSSIELDPSKPNVLAFKVAPNSSVMSLKRSLEKQKGYSFKDQRLLYLTCVNPNAPAVGPTSLDPLETMGAEATIHLHPVTRKPLSKLQLRALFEKNRRQQWTPKTTLVALQDLTSISLWTDHGFGEAWATGAQVWLVLKQDKTLPFRFVSQGLIDEGTREKSVNNEGAEEGKSRRSDIVTARGASGGADDGDDDGVDDGADDAMPSADEVEKAMGDAEYGSDEIDDEQNEEEGGG